MSVERLVEQWPSMVLGLENFTARLSMTGS